MNYPEGQNHNWGLRMFFAKDVRWIIARNLIFIGRIFQDIGMHRFRLISGFVFNIGFV